MDASFAKTSTAIALAGALLTGTAIVPVSAQEQGTAAQPAAGAGGEVSPGEIETRFDLSEEDRALLARLSPSFRQYVLSRMGPDQTVSELVETTILNELSEEYAQYRNPRFEGPMYVVEVRPDGGEWTVVEIDPATIVL